MNSGCSSRQAVHHEANTLTSDASPRRSSLDRPGARPWTGDRSNSGTGLSRRADGIARGSRVRLQRSEEHTSELQSLMRISYAVSSLTKKTTTSHTTLQPND